MGAGGPEVKVGFLGETLEPVVKDQKELTQGKGMGSPSPVPPPPREKVLTLAGQEALLDSRDLII